MEFFNQKEEVIDIKLTQYGKRVLAQGEFKPVYYSFFDKDILYNSEFGGFAEQQNDTETRIKSETARLKVQHNYIGVETQFNEMTEIIRSAEPLSDTYIKEKLQDIENKYFALASAVGNTRIGSTYAPAWEAKFYNESLSGSSPMLTSSASPNIKIPQLTAEIKYTTYMTDDPDQLNIPEDFSISGPGTSDQEMLRHEPLRFEDGSAIILEDGFALLGIDEKNTNFLNENFEIEVFMEETIIGSKEATGKEDDQKITKLIPLQFYPRDADEQEKLAEAGIFPDTDTNFVEYYFDINIDEEIMDALLCKYVHKEDKKSIYVQQIFKCDEEEEPEVYGNIYEDDDKLGEPCE